MVGINKLVSKNSRWLALTDLFIAFTCALIWIVYPQIGWIPLVLAFIPWLIRMLQGVPPFRRTPFDFFLLIFLATSLLGVWTAYDRQAAGSLFWLIVSAIIIYYAIAGQPQVNVWILIGILCLISAMISGFVLLSYTPHYSSSEQDLLKQLSQLWINVRPSLELQALHPNRGAGLIAFLVPFTLALGAYGWMLKRPEIIFVGFLFIILSVVGLLFTRSRGAVVALASAVGLWILWVVSRSLAQPLRMRQFVLFLLLVSVMIFSFFLVILTVPKGLWGLLEAMPGPSSIGSRLEIASNTLDLFSDFLITGGGLNAFPGLYSQYILLIRVLLFQYSHNLFLDVGLSQGLFGLISLLSILIGTVLLILRRFLLGGKVKPTDDLLGWAVITSVMVMVIHGLVDNAIYAERGTPLLLVPAGLAVLLTQPAGKSITTPAIPQAFIARFKNWNGLIKSVVITVFLASFTILLLAFNKQFSSAWYANLGAVHLARLELINWPHSDEAVELHSGDLLKIERYFIKSSELNPSNRTAWFYLGLLAFRNQNFESAIGYLENAYGLDHTHRGVRKSLGYSYTWKGRMDKALELLIHIPEAGYEMDIYATWWGNQGRKDLQEKSSEMSRLLAEAGAPLNSNPSME